MPWINILQTGTKSGGHKNLRMVLNNITSRWDLQETCDKLQRFKILSIFEVFSKQSFLKTVNQWALHTTVKLSEFLTLILCSQAQTIQVLIQCLGGCTEGNTTLGLFDICMFFAFVTDVSQLLVLMESNLAWIAGCTVDGSRLPFFGLSIHVWYYEFGLICVQVLKPVPSALSSCTCAFAHDKLQ